MTFHKNKIYTKILVIFSIICSLFSLVLSSVDKGEIYPFFHFKLYSQPLGAKHIVTDYKIYVQPFSNSEFQRLVTKETSAYDYNAHILSLNFLIKNYLKNNSEKELYRKKILIFAKHIAPNHFNYKIVAETYHPLEVLKYNRYDTTTVIQF